MKVEKRCVFWDDVFKVSELVKVKVKIWYNRLCLFGYVVFMWFY